MRSWSEWNAYEGSPIGKDYLSQTPRHFQWELKSNWSISWLLTVEIYISEVPPWGEHYRTNFEHLKVLLLSVNPWDILKFSWYRLQFLNIQLVPVCMLCWMCVKPKLLQMVSVVSSDCQVSTVTLHSPDSRMTYILDIN